MSLTTVLLRDENTAGGATATDGSARTIVDTNGKLSFSGGMASFATGGAAAGNPGVWYPIQTRTAGIVLIAQVNQSSAGLAAGFDSNQSGAINDALVLNGTSLQIISNGTTITIGTISLSTDYIAYVVLRATGLQAFLKGGAFTYPTLFYIGSAGSGNEYPGVCALNTTSVGSSDFVRAAGYYLAPPIVSDGFSNNGTSDGLGHAETSGLGSGGGGVAWSGTTWSVSGGKAINTPVLGSELIVNGSMESGNPPSSWTAERDAILSATTEHTGGGGTQALRVAYGGVTTTPQARQDVLTTIGRWYTIQMWSRSSGTGASYLVWNGNQNLNDSSTTWSLKRSIQRSNGSTQSVLLRNSTTGYAEFDDVSIRELALSDLLSLHVSSTSDIYIGVDLTVVSGGGAPVGLALNWDSSSSPANGVIAYHDGTNCKLEKCVAGVWTTVVSAAATYSANARLVVSKIGTAYRLYYNNALVGSGTISDAGIISNTLHGIFSTYEGNTLDNYTCYASGTSGEYAAAFDISIPATGSSAGAGDSSAGATRKRTATGSSAGATTQTGATSVRRNVNGSSAGVGNASGAGRANKLANGASAGSGNASGAIGVNRRVAGQSDGGSTASASSSRKRLISGASAGNNAAVVHNYTTEATIYSS